MFSMKHEGILGPEITVRHWTMKQPFETDKTLIKLLHYQNKTK